MQFTQIVLILSNHSMTIQYSYFLIVFEARLGKELVESADKPDSQFISLLVGDVILDDEVIDTPEGYHLSASAATDEITIVGNDAAGVMYGCQTLFSMMGSDSNQIVPSGDVIDYPRFPYRGMHLDISRNFHGMDEITRLIHGMSMFKMNKLHMHLTDDEGWRLEIPGLPELTEVKYLCSFVLNEVIFMMMLEIRYKKW